MSIDEISGRFRKVFGSAPALLVRSPGRINLLGEHTDYNEGFVLPAAINKHVFLAVAPNGQPNCRFFASDYNEKKEAPLQLLIPEPGSWGNYTFGVVHLLRQRGLPVQGFDCVFGGDIPSGAGLSSSAALSCGLAFALNELFSLGLSKPELAGIGQLAEHTFAGVQCGIMDQYANLFGRKNHLFRLDCRTLEHTYFPLQLDGYQLILCDTGVKHALAATEYNTRRQECAQGVQELQKHFPEVRSLRDVSADMLEEISPKLPSVVYQRCRYVLEENQRVEDACRYLEQRKMLEVGNLMNATHRGLQFQYQVSCPELDFLVEQARHVPGVLGARMMGGGFGGCTLNLVQEEVVEPFVLMAAHQYKKQFGIEMQAYMVQTADGTSVLNY